VLAWHRAKHWSSQSWPEGAHGLPLSWQGAWSPCCPAMPAQQSSFIGAVAAWAIAMPLTSSASVTSAVASHRANGVRKGR